jgi:hypothetical protein
LIFTLLVTIIVEGVVALGYSSWKRKSFRPILLTTILANLITQSLLWIVLNLFVHNYLVILCFAEILIWIVESYLLYRFPANQLRLRQAALLSLSMNLASLGIGWLLPI